MNLFVPPEYRLIAKTEMPGTSGTIVRCYYHPIDQKVFFTVDYLAYEGEAKHKWISFGPLPKATLEPLDVTIKDVLDMQVPQFIEDK